jgi:hypothetical protein
VTAAHALAAQPLLLPNPRIYVRQLFLMKNIVASGFFLVTFLSCRRKSDWLERIRDKNHQDDGAQRMLWRQSRYSQISKTISGRRAG